MAIFIHKQTQHKNSNKTNFLQYNGLIKAIKQYLKQIKMKVTYKEINPFIPSNINPILRHCKGSKAMYEILNKTIDIPTEHVTKLMKRLKAMRHSLVARRWFSLRFNDGFDVKLEIVG